MPRERETYAIVLALMKWETWICVQPVLVLTDHQALEHWAREVLDAPSGPVGRRSRWHQFFSRFDLSVGYVPGKNNTVADVLSRFAYPASEAYRDISKHGSVQDEDEMEGLILRERMEERGCMYISAHKESGVEQVSRWFRGEVVVSQPPLIPEVGAVRSTVTPPWQFESLLAQNLVPAAGVLTVGSCEGCELDSQFFEEVTSFESACMNTTSEVTSVVSRTGSESACMNTTSKETSAVSVVHRLSEDISDSSSNSSGDGGVDPP